MLTHQTIGADNEADIVIYGRYVSPLHALLIEDGKRVFIKDLKSTYGTHVNGAKILGQVELKETDRVKIGTQLFRWKDYLHSNAKDEEYPIYIKDLFYPRGKVTWRDYKVVLLVALGLTAVIPLGIPMAVTYLKLVVSKRSKELAEQIEVWEISRILILLTGLVCCYIFVNLTQKAIRTARSKS